jgi:cytochrome P450
VSLVGEGRGAPASALGSHLLAFRRERVRLLAACAEAPGDVIRLRLRTPAYVPKRADDVRHVFTSHGTYAKAARMTRGRAIRIAGRSVLTAEGDDHRELRRQIQPAFRTGAVASLAAAVVRGVDRMIDGWGDGDTIDVPTEMNRFARRNILTCVVGQEDDPALLDLEAGVLELRRSLDRVRDALVPPPAVLPIAIAPRRRSAMRRVRALIDARLGLPAGESPDDLVSLILSDGDVATGSRVGDEALTLALTGSENVARTMTWALLALVRHPAVGDRLGDEVECVLGGRPPSGEDRARLRFTEMVLTETMRLWPPNPVLVRVARNADVLPSGTRVERGAAMLLSPYVLQRRAAYFPDPETFDPDRFGPEAERPPAYAYFPFGGGARICIGQSVAMLTCVLALARIAQRMQLELVPGEPVPPYRGGNVVDGGGPVMRVRRVDPR